MGVKLSTPIEEITDPFIGKQIKQARRILGLTKFQFAMLANVSQDTISNMERGRGITAKRIPRLMQASGQPWEFFYGEEGTTKPAPKQVDFRTWSSGALRIENDLMCLIK